MIESLDKGHDLAVATKVHAEEGRFVISARYLNEANKAILCDFCRIVWGMECRDPLATQLYLMTQLPYGIRISLDEMNDRILEFIKFIYDKLLMSRLNKTISKYAEIRIRFVTYVQDGAIVVRCIGDDFKKAMDKLKDMLSEGLINNLRKTEVNEEYLESLLRILKKGDLKSEEIDKLLQTTNKFIKLSGFSISTFLEIVNVSNTIISIFLTLALSGMGKIFYLKAMICRTSC